MKTYSIMIEEVTTYSIRIDAVDKEHAEDQAYEMTLNREYPYNLMEDPTFEEGGNSIDIQVWDYDND